MQGAKQATRNHEITPEIKLDPSSVQASRLPDASKRAFSSEADTGSREENASKQQAGAA
jgi:hypothetical protein